MIENRVDRAVREWKTLNEAPHLNSIELYDQCLSSETIIYNALIKFRPLEIDSFRKKLQALGYEVQDAATHHALAIDFGLRVPEEFRNIPLTRVEKEIGTQKLSFRPGPDGFWQKCDSGRKIFHPRLELWVRSIHEKLVQAYRREKIRGLEKEQAEREGSGSGQEENRVSQNFYISGTSSAETSIEGEFISQLDDNLPDSIGPGLPPGLISSVDSEDGSSPKSTFVETGGSSKSVSSSDSNPKPTSFVMSNVTQVNIPLPVLPQGWSAEGNFKITGTLSPAIERSIEPVGPHFLAHARRARHKRTFSEDDRIQAQENVKKIEDDDDDDISEPEDPMMLSRDAKDWKVIK